MGTRRKQLPKGGEDDNMATHKAPGPQDGQDADLAAIGARIKSLRIFHGMTQTDLADRLGVTKGAISQWETGHVRNLKLAHLFALCDVFRVDVYALAYGPDQARRRSRKDAHP